ncbi:hypothetical protein [uncultured Pseudokineococcus sp.]|uniref:hypothetical protein n=1 Tax=uncultured Pseudokineococcus sp. TaxID=1642928 RepID=UPI00262CF0BF|nr:hypothetical protein [uncultured Pseudokineococcus sp.]
MAAGVEALVGAAVPAAAAASGAAAALRLAAAGVEREAAVVRAEVARARGADAPGWRSRAAEAYRARLAEVVARGARDAGALDELARALRAHAAGAEARAEAVVAAVATASALADRAAQEGGELGPRLLRRAEGVLEEALRAVGGRAAALADGARW